MFFVCLCIVDISIHIMEIEIVGRRFWMNCSFPRILCKVSNRSRRESLHVSCIVGSFLCDILSNKGRSTFFLCFSIFITYGCICSEGYMFFEAFEENSCNDRLRTFRSFFSFYYGSKYESIIGFFPQFCITFSDLFLEFIEEYCQDIFYRTISKYSIGIWIEESFETFRIFKKWVFCL